MLACWTQGPCCLRPHGAAFSACLAPLWNIGSLSSSLDTMLKNMHKSTQIERCLKCNTHHSIDWNKTRQTCSCEWPCSLLHQDSSHNAAQPDEDRDRDLKRAVSARSWYIPPLSPSNMNSNPFLTLHWPSCHVWWWASSGLPQWWWERSH